MHTLTCRTRNLALNGQGLVEFALVLPVLVFVLLGVFDLGRAIYANTTVSNTAREAARAAIACPDATSCSNIENNTIKPTAVGIYSTDSSVFSWSENPALPLSYGDTVTVTVTYSFTAATPFIGQYLGSGGYIVITSHASMISQ